MAKLAGQVDRGGVGEVYVLATVAKEKRLLASVAAWIATRSKPIRSGAAAGEDDPRPGHFARSCPHQKSAPGLRARIGHEDDRPIHGAVDQQRSHVRDVHARIQSHDGARADRQRRSRREAMSTRASTTFHSLY